MHIKICFKKKKEKDRALSAKEEKMKRKKERLDRERQKWKAEKAEQRKRDMEEARRRQSVNAYKKQESNSLGDPFGNHGDENASTLQDDSNDIRQGIKSIIKYYHQALTQTLTTVEIYY